MYEYSTLQQCTKIYDVYYCQQNELQSTQNTCTPAIIALQKAYCNYTTITWERHIIPLTENTIFVEPGPATIEISSNCTRKSNKISTTSILSYSECYINIDGDTFSSNQPITFREIYQTLPWNDVNIQHILPGVTLHAIHNWTIQNIEELHAKHEGFKLHTSISYTSTGLLILLLICLAIFIFYRKRLQHLHAFQFLRNRKSHLGREELHTRPPTTHTASQDNIM